MKVYCQECNQPTDYIGAKPRFCSACGNPFGGVAKIQTAAKKIVEEEEPNVIPNITKLDVEIISFKQKGTSLKDTILSGLDGPREIKREAKGNIEQIRAEWKKEASNFRSNDDTPPILDEET